MSVALGTTRQQVALVRAYALGLTMLLGGCSASEIVQNWSSAPVSDLSQPNHRRIVGENIKTLFPDSKVLGDLEISGVRLVEHFRGQVWRTCLKIDAHVQPQLYAIFIQDGKIIDSRASIVIDQCGRESYEPFELPPPKPETCVPPARCTTPPSTPMAKT
jgi:hypothetical protein